MSFGFITGSVMGWVEGITREHWKDINGFSRLFKTEPHTRSYQSRASLISKGNEGDFCGSMTWTIALTDFVTEVTIYNINACDIRSAHKLTRRFTKSMSGLQPGPWPMRIIRCALESLQKESHKAIQTRGVGFTGCNYPKGILARLYQHLPLSFLANQKICD